MNRQQRLTMADAASQRAADLARRAQAAAERSGQAVDLAAAGSLWADITRSHAAIAAVLPADVEDETEETD
ncbi:hypothetical protein [Streptomyces sp. NPDC094468]|uniref:hypothetical protein n=1 Tax=Streptomyces sp. NPDC094468 TaxID=3366066 RepID=UPI0037FBC31C